MKIEVLHQELILKHNRSSTHRRRMANPDARIPVQNPLCGDEITLEIRIEGGAIAEVGFTGHGCAISQAAASMMAERIEGRTIPEARRIHERYLAMLRGDAEAAVDPLLGDLRALVGVARLPQRIRCAQLPWSALAEIDRALGSPNDAM